MSFRRIPMNKMSLVATLFFLFFAVGICAQGTAVLTFNPSFLIFGPINVGSDTEENISISCVGSTGQTNTISRIEIVGSDAFSIQNAPTTPFQMNVMDLADVLVSFSPYESGYAVADLEIEHSGGITTIPLEGEGVANAFVANPGVYSFGSSIPPGYTGQVDIELRMNMEYTYSSEQLLDVSLTGDSGFYLWDTYWDELGAPQMGFPYSMEGTSVLTFRVQFSAPDTNPKHATLTFYAPNGNETHVYLDAYESSISAWPEISVTPYILYIEVNPNSATTSSFEISNTGGETLNYMIGTSSGAFSPVIVPSSGSVAPSSTETLMVTVDSSGLDPGDYNAYVPIQSNDPVNSWLMYEISLHVNTPPIVVDFMAYPMFGHPPQLVMFNDTSVVDPTGGTHSITGWRWDFENDGITDSYLQNPTHIYNQPGIYSPRLTVISNTGQFLTLVKQDYVQITNYAPQVHSTAIADAEFMEDTVGGPIALGEIFFDPDYDPMTYTATNSAHISAVFSGNLLYLQASPNWHGTEILELKATDPFKLYATFALEVTVLPVNDAPYLSIPSDMHFIRNSVFAVDFSQYIDDPDTPLDQISITLQGMQQPMINFVYYPINAPGIPGQFEVRFSSPLQTPWTDTFTITVDDHQARAESFTQFNVHLLDHFEPTIALDADYLYTGQTVQFRDATLGNPNYWLWEFGDGNTSTARHPSHVYQYAGVYDVRLTLGHDTANEEATFLSVGLISMSGTAVNPDEPLPPVWTQAGSPYNLFGEIVIEEGDDVEIEEHVEIQFFGTAPIQINGVLNATRARFKPLPGGGNWGGLKFGGVGNREPSILTECDIIDAILPVDIDGGSPQLTNVKITVSDTTQVNPGIGLRVKGSSAAVIQDCDLINYGQGISIEPGGGGTRNTPTLTNIRVRNSSESSRDFSNYTGISLTSDAILDNVLIDNFGTAMKIEGTDEFRSTVTPTLTNIRVRNSSESSRNERYGVLILGNAAPIITELDIEGVTRGLYVNTFSSSRSTPTLTNIRVRNSSESSRNGTEGLRVEETESISITDLEVEGFDTGAKLSYYGQGTSTPTLTNIRVRNSSESSRQENYGLEADGKVVLHIDDAEIEGYDFGVKYSGTGEQTYGTPTLTNIRVRNSSESSRLSSIGMQLKDLRAIQLQNVEIEDFNVGMEVINTSVTRALSTPTLTNIRVRNSTESSRYDNVGIYLGAGVGGNLAGCKVEQARIGIFIADGNTTNLKPNKMINCEIGLKAAGSLLPLPIRRQIIALDPAFAADHQDWQFRAMDINLAGPWVIDNNTINGYPMILSATNANISMMGNIAWRDFPMQVPFGLTSTNLIASYNNFRVMQMPPGVGNINANPLYENELMMDFRLTYNSPCIDTGNPLEFDEDGSRSDMGALPYLHRSSAVANQRFVLVGSTVQFTNTSIGHDQPFSTAAWDLNNDGSIEATSRDWSYQFNTPGVYNLSLRMQTGTLVDTKLYQAIVVVQTQLLNAPQNVELEPQGPSMLITWDPVIQNAQGDPVTTDFYIVYQCDKPSGYFDFAGFTANGVSSFTDVTAYASPRRFYIVLAFIGSRADLMQFIEDNRQILPGAPLPAPLRNKP